MQTAVYAIPAPIYVSSASTTFTVPDTLKVENVSRLKIDRKIGAKSRYGLNLPQRDFVLSAITPIIGSLTASQTRAMIKIMEIAAADNPTMSV